MSRQRWHWEEMPRARWRQKKLQREKWHSKELSQERWCREEMSEESWHREKMSKESWHWANLSRDAESETTVRRDVTREMTLTRDVRRELSLRAVMIEMTLSKEFEREREMTLRSAVMTEMTRKRSTRIVSTCQYPLGNFRPRLARVLFVCWWDNLQAERLRNYTKEPMILALHDEGKQKFCTIVSREVNYCKNWLEDTVGHDEAPSLISDTQMNTVTRWGFLWCLPRSWWRGVGDKDSWNPAHPSTMQRHECRTKSRPRMKLTFTVDRPYRSKASMHFQVSVLTRWSPITTFHTQNRAWPIPVMWHKCRGPHRPTVNKSGSEYWLEAQEECTKAKVSA